MNVNLVMVLVIIDAVLLGAIIVIALVVNAMRRDRQRSVAELIELRSSLDALRSQAVESRPTVSDAGDAPVLAPFVPIAALTTDKRAEALEMLRCGTDSRTVSVRLQIPKADVELLGKVQSLLGQA
jgi:hypothetical protein